MRRPSVTIFCWVTTLVMVVNSVFQLKAHCCTHTHMHTHTHTAAALFVIRFIILTITDSAAALHTVVRPSKINRKMENSTPCKIVTHENFILKLGTRDYVENITHYTNFHVHRFSGGFSTNRWNPFVTFFLSCPFFLVPMPSSNRTIDIHSLWLKWRGSVSSRMVSVTWCSCVDKTDVSCKDRTVCSAH